MLYFISACAIWRCLFPMNTRASLAVVTNRAKKKVPCKCAHILTEQQQAKKVYTINKSRAQLYTFAVDTFLLFSILLTALHFSFSLDVAKVTALNFYWLYFFAIA